jgi:ankyrin repeat protein
MPALTKFLQQRGDEKATLAGDAGRVAELVKAAPWSVDALSPDGWTALHLAAFLGQSAVVRTLLEQGADARVFSRAMEQNLPIHAAAAGRRIDKASYSSLISATGDPDVLQKQGYTALMIAAANGFVDAADVLLSAGADKKLKTPDRKTAADIAQERGHDALSARLK